MACICKGLKEAKQLTWGSDKQSGSAKLFHCAACNKEYQAVHERFNFLWFQLNYVQLIWQRTATAVLLAPLHLHVKSNVRI